MNRPTPRHRRLTLLLCAAALLLCAPPAAAGVWSGIGLVRAPGGPFLRDAQGRRLQLHGADIAAKCGGGAVPQHAAGTPCVGPASGTAPAFVLSPTARDPGRRFTAADARSLHDLGFTLVRLGIVWQGLEPGPAGVGSNDPRYCAAHRSDRPFPALRRGDPYRAADVAAYLARTDRIVSLLAHAGLRVILDMHQDAYGSAFSDRRGASPWNGEGAPPWATCTGHHHFARPSYWGLAYIDSAVQSAIGHFWRNDVRGDLQGQFARVWHAVARHYRRNPDVLGYEVFNEPTDFAARDFNRQLECAYAGRARAPRSCAHSPVAPARGGLIGVIQSADPAHLVFFEESVTSGLRAAHAIAVAEPLRFRRLVLAVHIYGAPPKGVFGCPGTVCERSERRLLGRLVAQRARMRTLQPGGPAMILDEFGGGPSVTDIADVASFASRASLSWSYWAALQLHDPTGSPGENLLNDRTARPWPQKAAVLAGPYPLATAGTPDTQRYDPLTRAYQFTYTVDRHVSAATEIIVPPYTYPTGYGVTVQGGSVVSAANAFVLRLRPVPGARRVLVDVLPTAPVP